MGLCLVLLLVYVALPYWGLAPDLSAVTRADLKGLWIALVAVVLNILWAVYYGCQKSAAGVGLSVLTAIMVAHSYKII